MSDSLNWSDAKTMLKAYQTNSKALLLDPPNGTEILKGFTIEKADMMSIIENREVVDVFVMPAVKLSDVAKPDASQAFTVIIAGLDVNGDIVENSAVDFLAPCPTKCPTNYPK